jgi:hypothetical protein
MVVTGQQEFLQAQQQLLAELFSTEWLLDPINCAHPAVTRYGICCALLDQGGSIRWPGQRAFMPHLAAMLLDAATIVAITRGHLDSFKLGELAGFGDERVYKKIRSRVIDPQGFFDLMVELSQAGWHLVEGHGVIPLEQPDWPDLRVQLDGVVHPLYIECKKLNSFSENRIRAEIRDANRQLRAVTEPCYGVAVLDVSAAVPNDHAAIDGLPTFASPIIDLVQRAVSGDKNRSVGRAIVTWDEYMELGPPPTRTMILVRRRFVNVDHSPVRGVRLLPPHAKTFSGATVAIQFAWSST